MRKLSEHASITQSLAALWTIDRFDDALYTFKAGLTADLTRRSQIKVEVVDLYKTRPPAVTVGKNDVSLVTSLVYKFCRPPSAGRRHAHAKGAAVFKEFREFAVKGNVVDLAVGVIIGAAFGAIVSSLVADIVMPPLGLLLGGVDFKDFFVVLRDGAKAPPPYATLAAAKAAQAVTLNYGLFFNAVFNFLIVGLGNLPARPGDEPAAPAGSRGADRGPGARRPRKRCSPRSATCSRRAREQRAGRWSRSTVDMCHHKFVCVPHGFVY